MTGRQLRRVVADRAHPWAGDLNPIIDAMLGNGGGRANYVGDEDGVARRLDGGAVLSTGHYRGAFRSLNGNHLAALFSTATPSAVPSGTTAVLRVTDAGLLLGNGAGLGLSGPAGQQAGLAVDASGELVFSIAGIKTASMAGDGTHNLYNTAGAKATLDVDAAGALNLVTGGTPRVTIGATGGVGIGALPVAGVGLNVGGNVQALSGSSSILQAFSLGRVAAELHLAVTGSPGQYFPTALAGDAALNVAVPTAKLFVGVGTTQALTAGQTTAPSTQATLGFYGAAPVVRPLTLTQTYATAARTHANLTAATLNIAAGSSWGGVYDVGAITGQTTINNNFASVAQEVNALRVDLANTKQVLNSVIDDLQSLGLEQ